MKGQSSLPAAAFFREGPRLDAIAESDNTDLLFCGNVMNVSIDSFWSTFRRYSCKRRNRALTLSVGMLGLTDTSIG